MGRVIISANQLPLQRFFSNTRFSARYQLSYALVLV